jgi:hypothetical protein
MLESIHSAKMRDEFASEKMLAGAADKGNR